MSFCFRLSGPPAAADGRRPRADQNLVAAVARRLTPRDRLLCQVLFDHKVLTTEQVTDLCFDNLTTARHRLTALYELRVLDRFRPFRPVGSDPYHYLLDTLGVEVVAADRGIEVPRPGTPPQPGPRTGRQPAPRPPARDQRPVLLPRPLGTGPAEDAELAEWWSERRCAAEWGEVVRPDGFGTLRQRNRVVEFFVEYDRGTETLARLADKLTGYAELVHATGWAPRVCFWFPSPRREAEARRVLDPARPGGGHRRGRDRCPAPGARRGCRSARPDPAATSSTSPQPGGAPEPGPARPRRRPRAAPTWRRQGRPAASLGQLAHHRLSQPRQAPTAPAPGQLAGLARALLALAEEVHAERLALPAGLIERLIDPRLPRRREGDRCAA